MAYREKYNYDDMDSAGSRRSGRERMDPKSSRIIITVVIVGVLLCAAVVALWLLYFSNPEPEDRQSSQSLVVEPVQAPALSATEPEASPAAGITSAPPAAMNADLLARGGPAVSSEIPVPLPVAPQRGKAVWYTEHTVVEGETLESLSETYGISRETILSVNAIKNLSSIKPEVVLRIPDRDGQLYTVQSGDSLSIITNRFNPGLGWKTLQEINGLASERIYPGQKLFIPSATVDDDGSIANYDRFMRPSEGRVTGLYGQTVKYGTSEDIVVLQGIWIEGPDGSQVVASGTGVVVDVGNIPDGQGRFVVLSHENGYRTTYAHLAQVAVKVGDQVRQGEPVGTMGSTGNIGRTALYFSIEQEGTALNPANFF